MNDRSLVIDALAYQRNKAFGYQEYLFNLLNYFFEYREQLKYERIIVVCDQTQNDDFLQFKDKFEIVDFRVPNLLFRFYAQFIFPYKLGLCKQDVILHTANYSSLIKNCINILVIHDLLYLRKKMLPNFLMRLQRRIYVPRSVALADVIIAISEFTKQDILQNIPQSRVKNIVCIYNYFNFEKYKLGSKKSKCLVDCSYFLCVSSSAYHKNMITVLKAFEKFCSLNKKLNFCFVGDFGNSEACTYYEGLNVDVRERIHILKNISNAELSLLYADCEAYVTATLFEGLGMPIVEAMYFNAPLILSDLEVCREVSNNQGVFFDPNSADELCAKMLNFVKPHINSHDYVVDKFAAINTSQKYIDILNNI